MRAASEYGGVRWEDSRCGTLVDLRLSGGYCEKHRRQGLSSSGNGGKSNNKSTNSSGNMTFMQQQRMQNAGMAMPMKVGGGGQAIAGNRAGQASSYIMGTGGRPSLSEVFLQSLEPTTPAATLLPTSNPQLLKRAPKHMKKMPSSSMQQTAKKVVPAAASRTNNVANTKNPYLIGKTEQAAKRKEPQDLLGLALERKRARSSGMPLPISKKSTLLKPATAKSNKVFNPEGYEGSVFVPKPSAVLFHRNATASAAAVTPSPRVSSEALRIKQKSLAEMLKVKGGAAIATSPPRKRHVINKESLARSKHKILAKGGTRVVHTNSERSGHPSSQSNKRDAFASAFGDTSSSAGQSFDREALLNAKSRFSAAANAQEYARARSVVQELEAREVTKDGKNNSKQKDTKSTVAIVTTGWSCRTCKKTTPYKPVSCIHAKHDVRQKRELKGGAKSLGSRKERLDRHGKDEETGGLTLGSGLDWSGWRGGLG